VTQVHNVLLAVVNTQVWKVMTLEHSIDIIQELLFPGCGVTSPKIGDRTTVGNLTKETLKTNKQTAQVCSLPRVRVSLLFLLNVA
jgi:hypothetical protein